MKLLLRHRLLIASGRSHECLDWHREREFAYPREPLLPHFPVRSFINQRRELCGSEDRRSTMKVFAFACSFLLVRVCVGFQDGIRMLVSDLGILDTSVSRNDLPTIMATTTDSEATQIAATQVASPTGTCAGACRRKYNSALRQKCNRIRQVAQKRKCKRIQFKLFRRCGDRCPKCDTTRGQLGFLGLEWGYSLNAGEVSLSWQRAFYVSKSVFRPFNCGEPLYKVVVGPPGYDYSRGSLRDILEGKDDAFKVYTTSSSFGGRITSGLREGTTYSVLALAWVNDEVVSTNREAISITVSQRSASLRNVETWKGSVLATDTVNVTFNKNSNILHIDGSIGVDSFEPGDRISVVTTLGENLLLQVQGPADGGESQSLNVKKLTLDEVFENLFVDISVDISRRVADSASRRKLQQASIELERSIVLEEVYEDPDLTIRSELQVGLYLRGTVSIGVLSLEATMEAGGSIRMLDSLTLTMSGQTEKSFRETVWRSPFIYRTTFLVLGVPVWIETQVRADVFASLSAEAESSVTVEVVHSGSMGLKGGYEGGGWFLEPNAVVTQEVSTDVQGKASATASVGTALVLENKVINFIRVDLSLETGYEWSGEAELVVNNDVLMQVSTPFKLTLFDVTAFVDASVEGALVLFEEDSEDSSDSNSGDSGDSEDEDDSAVRVRVDEVKILSLPEIAIEQTDVSYCTGENAISLTADATSSSVSLIPNDFSQPMMWFDDFAPTEDIAKSDPTALRYVVSNQGSAQVTLSLPRRTTRSDRYELPAGKLWFRATPKYPSFSYTLVKEEDLSSLFPVEAFECCDDSDCELLYPEEDRVCTDRICDEPAPTEAPTQPSPEPTPCSDPCSSGCGDPCLCNPCLCAPCGCSRCCGASCKDGSSSGDPHMFTFDGLRYSCQAKGDFVLVQSSSGMQIHARFKKQRDLVSFATGLAVRSQLMAPRIELRIPESGGLKLELLVNGVHRNFTNGYEDEFYKVVTSTTENIVLVKATNVSIYADVRLPSSFTHFSIDVSLPQDYINSDPGVCGLLGTPDNIASNDWTTSDCSGVNIPTAYDELFNRGGYDYCTANWCIRNASESLFTYTDSLPFEHFSGCDEPYPGSVDLNLATPALRALCGVDIPCLTDGLEFGFDGAQSLLESESNIGRSARLLVAPSTIQVERSFNVEFTIDVTQETEVFESLDSFSLYRMDPETREVGDVSVVSLMDIGSGVGSDTQANDGIFSNVLAIRSDVAGESFGFKAVPVFNGLEDTSSPLIIESPNAVRSYSSLSGVGQNGTTSSNVTGTLSVANVSRLVLQITYSWPMDQSDLDTGTRFLGRTVGFCAASSAPYLRWTGDDTDFGGSEQVTVFLGESHTQEAWTNATSISLNAAWFPSSSRGPATVSVQAEVGSVVTYAVDPGRRSLGDSSCTTEVGRIGVTVAEDGSSVIEVVRSISS